VAPVHGCATSAIARAISTVASDGVPVRVRIRWAAVSAEVRHSSGTRSARASAATSALSSRRSGAAASLRLVVNELDAALQELRAIAGLAGYAEPSPVGLRRVVAQAAGFARRDLGVAVHARYEGPIDGAANPGSPCRLSGRWTTAIEGTT
jgi:hypothetical protein